MRECPECGEKMERDDNSDVWQCPICGHAEGENKESFEGEE